MAHGKMFDPDTAQTRLDVIKSIKSYQSSSTRYSAFQCVSTVGLLFSCYALIIALIRNGYWSALLLTPLAAGLAVRTFTLQHDCGHGSLFRSKKLNAAFGRLFSLLTFTPYDHWRRHHEIHHSGWNNLSHRGRLSDIYSDCITVAEYNKMYYLEKLLYILSKNPVISILLMPPIIFFLVYRVPFDAPGKAWRKERLATHLTTLGLILLYGGAGYLFGFKPVFATLGCVIYLASVAGVWLFLLQHKFEGAHWGDDPTWNSFDAAIFGCSFLKLPRILAWFSGNIGYHHVHHAAPGIPNYRLAACHEAHETLRKAKVIRPLEGLREISRHELWDEESQTMVHFKKIRKKVRRIETVTP